MSRDRRPVEQSQFLETLGNPDLLTERNRDEKSPQLIVYEQALREEILSLTGNSGKAFRMYMWDDLSIRQIADRLMLSKSTVHRIIEASVESIKQRLAAKGIN